MCRPRPGTRCSDYSVGTLAVTKKRLERTQQELTDYSEKYADSINKTENISARDAIRQQKHARLVETVQKQQEAVSEAEFEYHACPVGQRELQSDLAQAEADGNEALKEELTQKIEAGKEYRQQQREALKKLQQVEEKEGPEAAAEEGMQMFEQATEDETEANIGLAQSQVELDAARAAEEVYAKTLEEFQAKHPGFKPGEDDDLTRQRKTNLRLLIIAGAAVLAFTLAKQAATGQKSSLMQYGRSMMMRHVMSGGRKVVSTALGKTNQQEEQKEKQFQLIAQERAEKAKARVYQKAEQEKIVADRQAAREAEREAEKIHRRQIIEEQREAERQRRQEEYEHYQQLSSLKLPPEVEAELRKKVRMPRKKQETPEPAVA